MDSAALDARKETHAQGQLRLLEAYRTILSFLVPRHRKLLLALGVAMPMLAALETAVLALLALYVSAVTNPGAFFDSAIAERVRGAGIPLPTNHATLVISLSVLAVGGVLVKNVCAGLFQYAITRISESISAHFGTQFLRGVIAMPYEWHIAQNSSDLATALYWRELIGAGLIKNALQILSDSVLIAFLSLTLILVGPIVSLTVLVAAAASGFFIVRGIGPRLDRTSNAYRDCHFTINREALQILGGIKEIKLFGAGVKLGSAVARMLDLSTIHARRDLLVRMPRDLLEFLGIALLAGTVAGMTLFGEASSVRITGAVTLLAVTAWRVLPAMSRIANTLSESRVALPMVSQMLNHLERFREEDRRAVQRHEPAPAVSFTKSIRVDNLSFTYAGRPAPALEKISFTIAKGETVGLVGASGAGKSTLADLLSGLVVPTEGRIVIDETPLADIGRKEWMRLIGYVSQAPFICDDTLAGNIAFGDSENKIDRALVEACCAQAHLQEVIEELPGGIDAHIGERGMRLSGGQRQRVAIARALYRRPQVIILDEATSALDTKSEAMIRDTITSLHGTMTMLIISHRLTTVSECDKLLWIEEGRLKMFDDTTLVMRHYTGPQ